MKQEIEEKINELYEMIKLYSVKILRQYHESFSDWEVCEKDNTYFIYFRIAEYQFYATFNLFEDQIEGNLRIRESGREIYGTGTGSYTLCSLEYFFSLISEHACGLMKGAKHRHQRTGQEWSHEEYVRLKTLAL